MITADFNNETKHEVLRFDSVAEYIERATTQESASDSTYADMREAVDRQTTAETPQKWYGASSLDECKRLIEQGDSATADKIAEMAQNIVIPPLTSIKRRTSRGDNGDSIDMQAVYAGNLANAWTKCKRATSVGRRQISIILPMQGLSGEPAITFFWRSVAGLAMAEKLSEAGFSIKIEGDYSATLDRNAFKRFTHRITLKDYSQPLDISGLAGVICLAGFKRTYGFANYYKSFENLTGNSGHASWGSVNAEKLAPEELIGFESASTEKGARDLVSQMAQFLEFRLDGNSRLDDVNEWARNRL